MNHPTYFAPGTPARVQEVLEDSRLVGRRVRLYYGYTTGPEAGVDWLEEYDVVGRIGRSCGSMRVPLLVPGKSAGGGAILTAHVVRIQSVLTGADLYRHPQYRLPELRVTANSGQEMATHHWTTLCRKAGEWAVHARHKTREQADAYVRFMTGLAMSQRSNARAYS